MSLFSILISFLAATTFGITSKPVTAASGMDCITPDTVRLTFDLNISNGWHVYSTGLPQGGPTSAEITFDSIRGAKPANGLKFIGNEIENDDPVFSMKVRFFEHKVRFYQDLLITGNDWSVEGTLTYGACDESQCLPPQRVEFKYGGPQMISEPAVPERSSTETDLSMLDGFDQATWKPVIVEDQTKKGNGNSLWGLFITSFLGGLIALFTPCVWPVIPMTVSFFLKRSSNRKKAVFDAVVYGLSIITVYVLLGLAITLIFGANALNALATNAMVNILFFIVLILFALSFFGLFEISLPSSWSTGSDRKAAVAGMSGVFFMALTLTIVSFSCTGPIIGFLLVDAASTGSIMAPITGMLGFSVAMAIPFTLFAMFPGWLQTMPKSGSWMDKVKVSLGIIELAFSLKFLSVADMAYGWGILPRDLFILQWILMALVLGLYLLGIIGKKGSKKNKPGIISCIAGIVSICFSIWMIPGLWGAPLKAISAFTPPMSTQILGRSTQTVEPQFTDYNEALQASEKNGKPILIDFTGYGCVNCRKMEASVWTDPRVSEIINKKYNLVSLFVDDKTSLGETVSVIENGTKVKLRTIGDKWSLLQRYKFGANAQPFYVIIDSKGNLLNGPYTFDADPDRFYKFLIEK